MTNGERLAAAALSFVGVPFRLHGRHASTGLDCVGLLSASLAAIGKASPVPVGYTMRNSNVDRWLPLVKLAGLFEGQPPIETGDILLAHLSCQQHHILIADTPDSVVHAHAGLRRVVREAGRSLETIERIWRLEN